jgi:acyl carrier protein
MDDRLRTLAQQLIDGLNLEDITPDDLEADAPLFGDEGLGLDSIDALELVVVVERGYGVKIQDMEQGEVAFRSLRSLLDFIDSSPKV